MIRKPWVLLVGIALLVATAGATWLFGQGRPASGSDLLDQGSFLTMLQDSGISVTKTARTKAYAAFHLPQESEVGVWTDQGFLDAFFFPGHVEGNMTVEQTGEYAWQIDGLPRRPAGWSSNRTWYFLAHRNVVIATDSSDLYASLQRTLNK